MAGMFSYESSEVDWCEDNYKLSKNVVEYFNMMSSFTFFVISPIMLYLLHPYAMERYLALLLVWFMMIFVVAQIKEYFDWPECLLACGYWLFLAGSVITLAAAFGRN
ncbi:alkaline ceramidase 1-like isoform X1 [Xyrauchen texanus]|uniref:alkaline ceramidase 1-like isoform X1 n=1 Tax=Xyrauchen texanus TaxID=154827 RepID=UPI002241AD89|nr:alkaline ceramidase 1-like isoform X1 [Xyrauchen texanus]